jgi:hypothetical protein
MGDVGSAFLRGTFAVLPVVAAQHNPRLAVAGVLLVWPFVSGASAAQTAGHRRVSPAHGHTVLQRADRRGCAPGLALDARGGGERSGRRCEYTLAVPGGVAPGGHAGSTG